MGTYENITKGRYCSLCDGEGHGSRNCPKYIVLKGGSIVLRPAPTPEPPKSWASTQLVSPGSPAEGAD